ncbi:myelin-oligodendrocyte glycoprotein-like isoform X2 [Parambassis ranga]|uniref:Myelin-oligodendrocyte glycoprotein-like isoform X2 n=1 Tax=Parambassis ranga TaxID=210632 RepID=A0A6P7I0K3_9TELE|nr:myelin-oligodendrocyte glycoprotein-like isoform X2 [Parambassis ranga]
MGSEDGFLSSAVTLITFLLILIVTCVEGQYEVVGSPEPIVAAPGDDVILPCHVEPKLNVEALTVEWSDPDLKPDPRDRLKRVEYVHLYRDNEDVPDMKLETFIKRTMLFTDDLKQGNISLKIINVSEKDQRRYRCFIPKIKKSSKNQKSVKSLHSRCLAQGVFVNREDSSFTHSHLLKGLYLLRPQMDSQDLLEEGCHGVDRHN